MKNLFSRNGKFLSNFKKKFTLKNFLCLMKIYKSGFKNFYKTYRENFLRQFFLKIEGKFPSLEILNLIISTRILSPFSISIWHKIKWEQLIILPIIQTSAHPHICRRKEIFKLWNFSHNKLNSIKKLLKQPLTTSFASFSKWG